MPGQGPYWNDQRLAKRHGFADPRLVDDRPLEITDPQLATRAGNIRFYSATYRLFRWLSWKAPARTTARP